jgi:hypothetical protein
MYHYLIAILSITEENGGNSATNTKTNLGWILIEIVWFYPIHKSSGHNKNYGVPTRICNVKDYSHNAKREPMMAKAKT